MTPLFVALALAFSFNQIQAQDKLSAVIDNCNEFDMKTTPAQGEKFLLECVENLIKDVEFLDENELAARSSEPGVKQSKAQIVCSNVKKIETQILDIESVLLKSVVGQKRIRVLKDSFSEKIQLLNCHSEIAGK